MADYLTYYRFETYPEAGQTRDEEIARFLAVGWIKLDEHPIGVYRLGKGYPVHVVLGWPSDKGEPIHPSDI